MTPSYKIQDFYIAYYGRPADPSGLAFWVGGVSQTGDLIGSAIKHFGAPTTPEFSQLYPPGTPIETFLTQAYQNLFNRNPEAAGLKFWADGFRAWTTSGTYTEGEARAQILTEIVGAANGQTGTQDKWALTNKHKVADAMTASVKQYGTEAEYVTHQLDDARELIASVGHTNSSLNAALGRIKYGLVDGKDPETGAVVAPPIVVDAGSAGDYIPLPTGQGTRDIVKFKAASDAPFTYKMIDGWATPAPMAIGSFEIVRDKIDLTSFNLQTSQDRVIQKELPWTADDWSVTAANGRPVPYKSYADFFEGANVVLVDQGAGEVWNFTNVFIDVNKNGSLDPEQDLWIRLAGTSANSVTDAMFIF